MAHGTNVIEAPVVMPQDIAAVLGISSFHLDIICTSPEINMWAKYKPIEYNARIVNNTQRQSVNYGIINIPTWSNVNKMGLFWFGINTSATNAPDVGIKPIYWGYQRPSTYYRLTDFSEYPISPSKLGYFHGAEAPIGGSLYPEYSIESSGHLRINFKSATTYGNGRGIELGSLTYPTAGYSVSNMYFGVMLRKVGQNDFWVKTEMQMNAIPLLGAYVDINGLTSSFNGEYEVFPFCSDQQISWTNQTGQMTNYKLIALNEKETIGIGTTVERINIATQSLSARIDTEQSTRLLYLNILLLNNEIAGPATPKITFEVFDVNSTRLTSVDRTNIGTITQGGSMQYSTSIDFGNLVSLRQAYSVRATVIPQNVANYAATTAVCNVVEGKPRDV